MRSLTKPECRKWIEALRSGEYLQGTGRLRSVDSEDRPRYCCLGVLCEILDYKPYSKMFIEGSCYRDMDLLGLGWQLVLSNSNDAGDDFNKIASYIERMILPELPDE